MITFEHHRHPLGIGEDSPRLSWIVPTGSQRSYEIELSDGTSSGRVESSESVLVPWPGRPLASRERRGARVRVNDGEWGSWSWAEAGLLDPADWEAAAAAPPLELLGPPDGPAVLLRREFTAETAIAKARL